MIVIHRRLFGAHRHIIMVDVVKLGSLMCQILQAAGKWVLKVVGTEHATKASCVESTSSPDLALDPGLPSNLHGPIHGGTPKCPQNLELNAVVSTLKQGHIATLAHTMKVLSRLMIRIQQSIRNIVILARIGEHDDPNLVSYKIYKMINQGNGF